MDPRISFITLAVRDFAATKAFYVDGLGWKPVFDDGDVLMVLAGEHLMLSMWTETSFAAEVGTVGHGDGVPPITLAHNLPERDQVDTVLAESRAAGASFVEDAVEREWGGYSGYFADPDGFRWEVCWNPGEIGALVLP
jgi:catechol 2,3-dioxygenase-like lactoylglutathione lyase family enzyme